MLKEAKTLARASVVARFAKQEAAEAGARAAREAAQQELDFAALRQQVRRGPLCSLTRERQASVQHPLFLSFEEYAN